MPQKLTFTIEQSSISKKEELTKRQLEFTQGAIWAVLGGYDTAISKGWQLRYKFLKPQVKFGTLKRVSKSSPIWIKLGNVGVELWTHSIGLAGTAGESMGMQIIKKTTISPKNRRVTTRTPAYRKRNQHAEIQITNHIRINFIDLKKDVGGQILSNYKKLIPKRINTPPNKEYKLKIWLNLLKDLPPKPDPKKTRIPSWFKFDPEKKKAYKKNIQTLKNSRQFEKAGKELDKYEKGKLEEYNNLLKVRFEYDRLIGRYLGRKIMHELFHTIKFIGGKLDKNRHHHNTPDYLMYHSAEYLYKKNIPKVEIKDFKNLKKYLPGSTR